MSGDPGSLTTGGTTFNTAGTQVNTTCGNVNGGASGVKSSWQTSATEAFEGAAQKLVAQGQKDAQLAQQSKTPLDTASKALTTAQTDIQALQQEAAQAQAAAAAAAPGTPAAQVNMAQFDQRARDIFTTLKTAYQGATSALSQAAGQQNANGKGGAPGGNANQGGTPGGTDTGAAPGTEQKDTTANPAGGTAPGGTATPGGAATPTHPGTVAVNPPGSGGAPGGTTAHPALVPPPNPAVHTSPLAIGAPDPTMGTVPGPSDLVMSGGNPGTDPTSGLLSLGRTTGGQDPSTVLTGYTGPMSPAVSAPGPAAPVAPIASATPGGQSMGPMFGMGMGGAPSTLTSAGTQRSSRSGNSANTIEPEITARPPVSLGAPGMSSYIAAEAAESGSEEERTTNLVGTEKWTDEQIGDNVLGRPGGM